MTTGDANVHVQVSGSGMPLVWAHGLMSSIEAEDALGWFGWDAQAGATRLIRFDARGHGRSGAGRGPGAYQWQSQGCDLLAVADAQEAPRLIAGGVSMGCASAIHAAAQAPGRIAGLILAMPPMIWEHRAAQRALYKRIAQRGIEADGRAMARLMSRDLARTLPPWLTEASPDIAASLAIGVRAIERRIIPELFHGASISDLPPRADLAAIARVPALILAWDGDLTHPLQSAHALHRLLPNSTLQVATCHEDFLQFPSHLRGFAESIARRSV